MARYVAFLRAINVGGHVVKMERLRTLFEELGLVKVETFIASGNVVFESRASAKLLEPRIEKHLQKTLGYEVKTFLRSDVEVAAIAMHPAFAAAQLEAPGSTLYVALLAVLPAREAQDKLLSYPSKVDLFHFHGRELYWLCRTRWSESNFSGPRFEKTIGQRTTLRNANTLKRLARKYPPR